jgi:hypothetical protein
MYLETLTHIGKCTTVIIKRTNIGKLAVVTHTCDLSTPETKAGEALVPGQLRRHISKQDRRSCIT